MSEHIPHPPKALGQLGADDPSAPGVTIVGGQPPRGTRRLPGGVPVGIERALYLAASDESFCRDLLRDRADAAQRHGFDLTASERAMLSMVPEAQLLATIRRMDISEENVERRTFMRAVAAGALAVTAAEAFTGCDHATDGCRPPQDMNISKEMTGIRPDGPSSDSAPRKDGQTVDMRLLEGPAPGLDCTGIRPGDFLAPSQHPPRRPKEPR